MINRLRKRIADALSYVANAVRPQEPESGETLFVMGIYHDRVFTGEALRNFTEKRLHLDKYAELIAAQEAAGRTEGSIVLTDEEALQ